ncbi:MAG TPA: 2-amino-4-hydroxy-6-hydroxymethyldihydropteridine diphosphokinase [bacterium]|nr:2-amino-4-hydroxy-6-hydroxymethyldihydropteridine diphosphokinase [bacterium]
MPDKDYITLQGLKIKCIIGIFDWERKRKQEVRLDLKFPCDVRRASRWDDIHHTLDYKRIAKTAIGFVSESRFQLVETLAEKLAELLLERFALEELWLSVQKPGAIRGSRTVGVELHRTRESAGGGVVFSLGSNIRPAENLAFALRELDRRFGLTALSRVYETSPVKLKRQPAFWNLAAAVRTRETPGRLKAWLRGLEKKAGRSRGGDPNGPRTLDVDLILWNGKVLGPSLPHPDIPHKAFVLFPLAEIFPTERHPKLGRSYLELAADFRDKHQKIRLLPPGVLAWGSDRA